MTETPIRRLRYLLDAAIHMVNDGDRPSGLLVEALRTIGEIEADAEVSAAVRECEERGLAYRYETNHIKPDMRAKVWIETSHTDRTGFGPNLPAALRAWKETNGVEG